MKQYLTLQRQLLSSKHMFFESDNELEAALNDNEKLNQVMSGLGVWDKENNVLTTTLKAKLAKIEATNDRETKLTMFALILNELFSPQDHPAFDEMVKDALRAYAAKTYFPEIHHSKSVIEEDNGVELRLTRNDMASIEYLTKRQKSAQAHIDVQLPTGLVERVKMFHNAQGTTPNPSEHLQSEETDGSTFHIKVSPESAENFRRICNVGRTLQQKDNANGVTINDDGELFKLYKTL